MQRASLIGGVEVGRGSCFDAVAQRRARSCKGSFWCVVVRHRAFLALLLFFLEAVAVVAVTPVATVRGLDRVTLDWQSQSGSFISSTCRALVLRKESDADLNDVVL